MYRTTIKNLFLAAVMLTSIGSCTSDEFADGIERPSTAAFSLSVASLGGFADGGADTRATGATAGVADPGKTTWVEGDEILLAITLESTDATSTFATINTAATYKESAWAMTDSTHALGALGTLVIKEGMLMLPPSTKLLGMTAHYAPLQKLGEDGKLMAIALATAGLYEQYSATGAVADNACTFGAWVAMCSRIRIASSTGVGNEFIRFAAAGFIPTGSSTPLAAENKITLAADANLNAYVYGVWSGQEVVCQVETKATADADFELVFQKTFTAAPSENGKSYAFNALGADTYIGSSTVFTNLTTSEAIAALACNTWVLTDESVTDYTYIKAALKAIATEDVTRRISVVMPSCTTTVGADAFFMCAALSSISLPKVTTVVDNAFASCAALSSVSLPEVRTVGSRAFERCAVLSSVSLPKVVTVGSFAFNGCTDLSSVSLPKVVTVGSFAFNGCTDLSSVSLPKATTVGNSAFGSCADLSSVSLPKVATVGNSAFSGCTDLSTLTFNTPITAWGKDMFAGTTIPTNITLTLAPTQKAMVGEGNTGYTASTTDAFNFGTPEFCGYTLGAIKAASVR
jgi:hypothetical protein